MVDDETSALLKHYSKLLNGNKHSLPRNNQVHSDTFAQNGW